MSPKLHVPFGVQKKILMDLKRNQEVPTPQRKSHAQIARESSNAKLKISVERVRKINAHYKQSRMRRGLNVIRTIPPAPGRAELPGQVRSLVQENLNITQEQVRKKLGLTLNQFAITMQQFGVKFRRMKFEERMRAIKTLAFVIKPGTTRHYTNEEIAKELGFSRKYIEENRPRRGKQSGTKAQIEAVMRETIIWVDLVTKPNSGPLSYSQLLELTGSNPFTLSAALKQLRKSRAIVEVNTSNGELTFNPTKGERNFFIGSNGLAIRNAIGNRVGSNRAINSFSLAQLEKMYDQLSFLRIHGTFKVTNKMTDLIKKTRDIKRFEEFKRKNKMWLDGWINTKIIYDTNS